MGKSFKVFLLINILLSGCGEPKGKGNNPQATVVTEEEWKKFTTACRLDQQSQEILNEVKNGHSERIDEVYDSCGFNLLLDACYEASLKIVKFLIENGANINVKDRDGDTPLSLPIVLCTCDSDKWAILEYLLSHEQKKIDWEKHTKNCKSFRKWFREDYDDKYRQFNNWLQQNRKKGIEEFLDSVGCPE